MSSRTAHETAFWRPRDLCFKDGSNDIDHAHLDSIIAKQDRTGWQVSVPQPDALITETTQQSFMPPLLKHSTGVYPRLTVPEWHAGQHIQINTLRAEDHDATNLAALWTRSLVDKAPSWGNTYKERRGAEARKKYPHECGICGKRYLYYDSAKKHHNLRHPGQLVNILKRFEAPNRPVLGRPRNYKAATAQLKRQTTLHNRLQQPSPNGQETIVCEDHGVSTDDSAQAQLVREHLQSHTPDLATYFRQQHGSYTHLSPISIDTVAIHEQSSQQENLCDQQFAYPLRMPTFTVGHAPDTAQEAIQGLRLLRNRVLQQSQDEAISNFRQQHNPTWQASASGDEQGEASSLASATSIMPTLSSSSDSCQYVSESRAEVQPAGDVKFEDFLLDEAYLESGFELDT